MLVFTPALLLSFLALVSSVAGGVVRGTARDVVGADAGNIVRRAIDAAPQATPSLVPSPVPGALLSGGVHQKLGSR